MAVSSQQLALWVIESIKGDEWQRLADVCLSVLASKMTKCSSEELLDIVEEHLSHVAEDLRNRRADASNDGECLTFEIDDEQDPYIRASIAIDISLLRKLRRITPSAFEQLCADVLTCLGAKSTERTGQSNDGGVDFVGYNFLPLSSSLSLPEVSKAIVIGQAKRYKHGNWVKEGELRRFVGGALRKADEFRDRSDFGVLSPIIFAFWTTSEFERNAKQYARAMGIWFMNGITFAAYVKELGLTKKVMSMPEDVQANKAENIVADGKVA